MANKSRIAITGLGMVTPLGHDVASTWHALMQQRSGIDKITRFDSSGFPAQIAAEVKNFNPATRIKDKTALHYNLPQILFALAAAEEAMQDSAIYPNASTAERWGVCLGSSLLTQNFNTSQEFHDRFIKNGAVDYLQLGAHGKKDFSLINYAQLQTNCALALLLKTYKILGFSMSVHTACASGGQALGLALQALRRDKADYILAGGFDSMITPIGVAGFSLLGAVSTDNDKPQQASRPFDLMRSGFVLGEGAAFLILEKWESAVKRKAKIYAELAGEGNSLSSYRVTDSPPSGDGAIQAIRTAIKDANESIEMVDYINAHGTSTKMNDLAETNAIKTVFQQHAYQIPISSTKSQTGHLIAGAGALEAAFCALALHHGQLPMTMNRTSPDPECDLNYITEAPLKKSIRFALSNCFGFGGSNNCLALRHAGT
jgi:3-oxoacyl-(acyl-carrier-protein) synthase